MDVLLDASSVINLCNAGVLENVCEIINVNFLVTPWVAEECGEHCTDQIDGAREAGNLILIPDDEIDADMFLDLVDQIQLGNGETESIAAAMGNDAVVCTDDRKARLAAAGILGAERVIGSLRLLKWAVENELMACTEAFNAFQEMKNAGGFLPQTTQNFFCNENN